MRKRLILFAALAGVVATGVVAQQTLKSEVAKPIQLAPGVWFRQGDIDGHGHCNNGWIIFEDYVVVIDANFPSGADVTLADIRKTTDKPVRFVFDTHHHGDHAYGNAVWADQGAVVVSHENCLKELVTKGPQAFADAAKTREDLRKSRLKMPSLVFPDRLIFDDGNQRVELHYNGWGHTKGDAVAWLPKQKLLFTGDVCVNGPYNYMGEGNTRSWIRLLAALEKLGASTIAPGHGPIREAAPLLADQKFYFEELIRQIEPLVKEGKSLEQVQAAVKIPRYEQWTGKPAVPANIEHVYNEIKGKTAARPQGFELLAGRPFRSTRGQSR